MRITGARASGWPASPPPPERTALFTTWGDVKTALELRELLLAWCEERLGSTPRKVDVSLLTREGVGDPSSWWPELVARVRVAKEMA